MPAPLPAGSQPHSPQLTAQHAHEGGGPAQRLGAGEAAHQAAALGKQQPKAGSPRDCHSSIAEHICDMRHTQEAAMVASKRVIAGGLWDAGQRGGGGAGYRHRSCFSGESQA